MKRILVMSDIHANYPALRAIAEQVDPDRFDRIVHAGDLTVYGTFPNETIAWFRKRRNAVSVRGNTDRRVLRLFAGTPLTKPRKETKRAMYYWTQQVLLPRHVRFLERLPDRADFRLGGIRVRVLHGDSGDGESAGADPMPGLPGRGDEQSGVDLLITGHTHEPVHEVVGGVHHVNPGSVGRMFDGDPRASYAILTIGRKGIEVEHRRVAYPVEETAEGIRKHRLPAIFAEMFRQGRKLS
ncbi:MAG: metallophosphoesterase family protein [Deltaproteobacteria bacterium]